MATKWSSAPSSGPGPRDTVTMKNSTSNVTPTAAAQEFTGSASNARLVKDLGPFTSIRLSVWRNGVGVAGTFFAVQYSIDGGATWKYFDGVNGPNTGDTTVGPNGFFTSPWVTIPDEAKLDATLIRTVQGGGDGVTTTSIGLTSIEFK